MLSSRMSTLERSEREGGGTANAEPTNEGRAGEGRDGEGEGTHLFNRLVRLHHRFPVLTILMDVALVAIAYFGAYLVRWDTDQLPAELAYFRRTLAMVIVLKLMGLAAAGAYAPRFRHYSLAMSGGRSGPTCSVRSSPRRACSWFSLSDCREAW